MTDNSDFEVLQVPSEHDWLRDLYVELSPRRVLEIGTWKGGTLRTWIEQGDKHTYFVAVDLTHPNASEYGRWIDNNRLVAIWGDSTTEHVKYVVRRLGPYDFIFVDGDHDYDVVKEDVAFALAVCRDDGIVVLHDVVDGDGEVYGPGLVLDVYERLGFETGSFVSEGEGAPHGIGWIKPQ